MKDSWAVEADDAGVRLDKFLAAADRLGSRSRVAAALQRGKVFLNDDEATLAQASYRLARGDVVRLWVDRPGSSRARLGAFVSGDLHILHEDDDIIVVDKPAGVLAVPLERREQAPSIFELIEQHWRSQGKRRPLVVHRIDRDTSGLVLFSTNVRAQQHLKAQFRRQEPERIYLAVVHGYPQPEAGEWHDRLVWNDTALLQRPARANDPRGIDAACEYRVVEALGATALLEVRLHTGKQNQIRVQAQMHGHPLVGERRYIDRDGPRADRSFPRQALHAYRLAFRHPANDREVWFEAPIPKDLRELLARLRRSDAGE